MQERLLQKKISKCLLEKYKSNSWEQRAKVMGKSKVAAIFKKESKYRNAK